jgi:hypothetical protein
MGDAVLWLAGVSWLWLLYAITDIGRELKAQRAERRFAFNTITTEIWTAEKSETLKAIKGINENLFFLRKAIEEINDREKVSEQKK